MATNVPSADKVAEKWARVAAGRSSDYQAGVTGAGSKWEQNTAAAVANFQAAVTSGNIGKMFAGGVKRAGAAKFERKATGVGKDRFSSGVNAAVQDMKDGIQPMLETIASVTPPPRGPRGSDSNIERVRAYAKALNMKRLALRSAGG